MENPATWGPIEDAISDAMIQHAQDMNEGLVGLSAVRKIADELRKRGLVKEAV